MKLQHSIDLEQIHLGLVATDGENALQVVADRIVESLPLGGDQVMQALKDRESLGSTSVGGGFAIPHCKLGGLSQIELALARFEDGFEFNATDGRPVSFFFIVLSPPDQPASHLQVLSQIARVLKRSELREQLLSAPDEESVLLALRSVAEQEGL
ncbi:MAG: PTS sugar transporter subunit IIA [bacterium]|nr:PTS sugar transporter subunit IIA [bacterium]